AAEVLRLWLAATDYSGELSISDEILKRVVEGYRRIRNTLRFLLANTADFDPDAHALPLADWLEIDRYALALTQSAVFANRLFGRTVDLGRDPEACGRGLPPHPQHAAG